MGLQFEIGKSHASTRGYWRVFIWEEFSSAPPASRKLIPAMFILFLLGLGSIAIAPTVTR